MNSLHPSRGNDEQGPDRYQDPRGDLEALRRDLIRLATWFDRRHQYAKAATCLAAVGRLYDLGRLLGDPRFSSALIDIP